MVREIHHADRPPGRGVLPGEAGVAFAQAVIEAFVVAVVEALLLQRPFETLRKDEEFVLYRGRSRDNAFQVLLLSPSAQRPLIPNLLGLIFSLCCRFVRKG